MTPPESDPPPLPPFGGSDISPPSIESSRVVIVPVPYDRTASYMKGSAEGPRAVLEASAHMELYDEEIGLEPLDVGIHTAPAVSGNEDAPEVMARKVETAVARYLEIGKMPVVLGGEHSVSIGAIRAYEKRYPRLSVVQLDAHGDLRDSYDGSDHNHACVMRHFTGRIPTLQLGIRSLSKEEAVFLQERRLRVISAREFIRRPQVALDAVDGLTDEIYLTIDVDYFDPAIMPATGTPEPGGPGWYETLDFLRALCRRKKLVGFDINELRPLGDDVAPNFLTAKLLYKVVAYRFFAEGRSRD